MANEVAGPGEVFVCLDCGRRSKDRLGHQKIHSGWGHSCSLNAFRYRESDLLLGQFGVVEAVRKNASPLMTLN